MDIFDKFFKKFAYKFDKGYPDMNNSQDVLLLESLFEKLGIDLNESDFNSLTFYDLRKRGGPRFGVIADKIENGSPFELVGGKSTPLEFIDPSHLEVFASMDAEAIKNLTKGANPNNFKFFKDDANNEYSISDLLKNQEFGGKGKGSGTVVEDANLMMLNKLITKLVEENDGPIDVEVNGEIYKGIVGAKSQFGTPKSDFNLVDINENPVVFISHKKAGGKGPSGRDFIRWSGYTMYKDHPEVKKFNQGLEKFLKDNNLEGLPKQSRFISPIEDDNLIQKLIYGPKFGEKYSKDNVNIILQGKISLSPKGDGVYKLEAEHVETPPSITQGDYEPYLTSAYRGDYKMFDIPNNEAIVMPKATAFSSSNVYQLKGDKFEKIK
jgi:hypothetical protein